MKMYVVESLYSSARQMGWIDSIYSSFEDAKNRIEDLKEDEKDMWGIEQLEIWTCDVGDPHSWERIYRFIVRD